uniref:Uncharacterized protein n=1 Tax=Sphaerodactylus townsendi TaxID=933632 RepID=A0ACB8FI48_9SAUR
MRTATVILRRGFGMRNGCGTYLPYDEQWIVSPPNAIHFPHLPLVASALGARPSMQSFLLPPAGGLACMSESGHFLATPLMPLPRSRVAGSASILGEAGALVKRLRFNDFPTGEGEMKELAGYFWRGSVYSMVRHSRKAFDVLETPIRTKRSGFTIALSAARQAKRPSRFLARACPTPGPGSLRPACRLLYRCRARFSLAEILLPGLPVFRTAELRFPPFTLLQMTHCISASEGAKACLSGKKGAEST